MPSFIDRIKKKIGGFLERKLERPIVEQHQRRIIKLKELAEKRLEQDRLKIRRVPAREADKSGVQPGKNWPFLYEITVPLDRSELPDSMSAEQRDQLEDPTSHMAPEAQQREALESPDALEQKGKFVSSEPLRQELGKQYIAGLEAELEKIEEMLEHEHPVSDLREQREQQTAERSR